MLPLISFTFILKKASYIDYFKLLFNKITNNLFKL